ncbi:hypothetical protein [Pseudarthrobacter sp. WHRI 8279]|uniref:hypothetical protein n=1 Tax=Pseudarthrobacter sp. WHRI 8279 TaxID=3162566 RepID=UPI0035A97E4F
MVLQLSSDVFGTTDSHGLVDIERSLAVMMVLGVGDVSAAMTSAGAAGSHELGERLVRVMALAQNLVTASPQRREPGDPVLSSERAAQVRDELFVLAMGRLSGDWGGPALSGAGDLVENLVEDVPDFALNRLPAILGGVLTLVEKSDEAPPSSLEIVGGDSSALRALEAETTGVMRRSAIRHLLAAVRVAAVKDPAAVCVALVDAITDERDTERTTDVAWYLMDAMGEVGQAHGDLPGVLGKILPVLYTHLVGPDARLRARSLDVWVKIGRSHELPSSLVELLPALARDNFVVVVRSVLRAAVVLSWPAEVLPQLLLHAASSLNALRNGSYPEGLKEAIHAVLMLTTRLNNNSDLQLAVQASALAAAEVLSSFDLRDVLRANGWGQEASRSVQMAQLRFKQAVDPLINDRFNQRGEPELTALLDCGAGLLALEARELAEAALRLGSDRPVEAAEFIEVAWRTGRLTDAVTIMNALLAATPDQPAYADQKLFFDVVAAVLQMDAGAIEGLEWKGFAEAALGGAAVLTQERDAGVIKKVADSAVASVTLRRLLMAARPVDPADPPADLRDRAQALKSAGEAVAKASVRATATGAYLRGVAALCDVVAHLLRAEAAAFDAQTEQMSAHKGAAERRSELLASALIETLGKDDPLGGPLLDVVEAARSHPAGSSTAALFEKWRLLPLPLPIVVGPRRAGVPISDVRGRTSTNSGEEVRPVAVALLSLDHHLVTGPEVLRRGRVYELSARVQAGEWPTWATRLDGELLSHLTPAEISTPTFSWSRADHVGDGETYEQAGSIVLRFSLAPGASAPPLLMRLIWRGETDGKTRTQSLDVAGHRELRLRPYDETRDRATNYPVFDERLLEMYDRLARAGFDEDQLQAFCRLFTSICRVGLEITWEKKYRRGARVTEKEFHDDIHNRLLADVELGGRVERGSPLALGFLDVRHDGITAELKVERKSSVTKDRAPKYMGQPTQYAAANGARLSILTILDMSPKQLPIGTPENYLFDLIPKLHGLENPEAPSLVAVLVVNGNLPTPSSWSRKKTPVQSASCSPGEATSVVTGQS